MFFSYQTKLITTFWFFNVIILDITIVAKAKLEEQNKPRNCQGKIKIGEC